MPKLSLVARILAPLALLSLAACQTPPTSSPSSTTTTSGASQSVSPEVETDAVASPEAQALEPLLVFLADTTPHADWAEVQIDENSTLYMEADAFITRDDLEGVEAGSSETGEGLLALNLKPEARQRLHQLTQQHTGKRLALVVDGTLLAVPSFSKPIDLERLIFAVGSKENAMMAARIIAGEAD